MEMNQGSRQKGQFKQLTAFLFFAVIVLLSCSREENSQLEGDLVTLYPIMSNEIETQVTTRAGAESAENYIAYSGHRQNIYAEAVAYDGANRASQFDASGWFLPDLENEGKWFSRVNVHSGKTYYLYCYTSMPVNDESLPTFTYNGSSDVTLTFTGFDIITTIDPLVSTASAGKLLCDDEDLTLPKEKHYPQLSNDPDSVFAFGKFNIGTVTSGSYQGHPATTKVFLALDHLFAKATISFKVEDKYNNIRTIKIKEATISTTQGLFSGTHTYSFVDREFKLDRNGTYSTKNLSIDLVGADAPSVTVDTLKRDENGWVVLDNTATEFAWFCFLPRDAFPPLDLTVKYNVYDKEGHLIRENQTATNANLIKISSPEKGKNYNITVNIKPSYLYQLSDDDAKIELTLEDS